MSTEGITPFPHLVGGGGTCSSLVGGVSPGGGGGGGEVLNLSLGRGVLPGP